MKLNYTRTICVGFAFMSICSFWQLYDNLVPLILKDTFLIGDTWSGIIMASDNVLALFLLPIFGAWSDKTNTRFGKRMPFVLFGTIGAVSSMLFIAVGDNRSSFFMFMIALGATLLFMSVYRSPAVALMPDVTPEPLRSKANAVINLMGAVGSVVSLLLISFLVKDSKKPDYFPIFLIVALFMALSIVVLLFTVHEKKIEKEMQKTEKYRQEKQTETTVDKKMSRPAYRSLIFLLCSVFLWYMGYNAVTTSFSKYAQVRLHIEGGGFASSLMIATVAAVISYIPVGIVATKIGRKKTILAGVLLMLIAFGTAVIFTKTSIFIYVLFVLTGIGWAAINVNSYPMVVEISRNSNIGKYTGYYYIFSMTAQIVTPILSGALLEYVGYWTLFPYAALFLFLALITMLFVRHGESRPQVPKDKWEMLDTGDVG